MKLHLVGCNFINNSAVNGGALYSYFVPIITEGCNFITNSASNGGAIYSRSDNSSDLEIFSCTFSKNSANSGGGAIYINGAGQPAVFHLSNSNFSHNSATCGGALYPQGISNAEISECLFESNKASNQTCGGGAIRLAILSLQTSVVIYNSRYLFQSSLLCYALINIIFSRFIKNDGFDGGAISIFDTVSSGRFSLFSTFFAENTATIYGGAVHTMSDTTIFNSTFVNNSATYGGAIDSEAKTNISQTYVERNHATLLGGGIFSECFNKIPILLSNSTIVENTASSGGGVYISRQGIFRIYHR